MQSHKPEGPTSTWHQVGSVHPRALVGEESDLKDGLQEDTIAEGSMLWGAHSVQGMFSGFNLIHFLD